MERRKQHIPQLQPGKTAGVVGLGVTGRATVRFLLQQGLHLKVSELCPPQQVEREEPGFLALLEKQGVVCEFTGHSPAFLDGIDILVPAPGVPSSNPLLVEAERRHIPLAGELALAAGRFGVPVIAVSGSNGKTTVTALIGHLLRSAGKRPFVGGNIGIPLLEYCLHPEGYDCVVLELSSFQLDRAGAFRPDVAVLLNITPDHLDRHGSMAAYTAAKMRLFAAQRPGDTAIVGSDDALAAAAVLPVGVRRLCFGHGTDCAAQVEETGIRVRLGGEQRFFPLDATGLTSMVNRLNAAAAVLAAGQLTRDYRSITCGLVDFQPAPHRMAEVAVLDGVSYVDDSKATNIGALAAALGSCTSPVVLIAGGRDKGGDYGLARVAVVNRVRHLLLLGEAAPLMEAAWGDLVPNQRVESMAQAVRAARAVAEPGDVVLLAPGCSSFDMFTDYKERGRAFARAVQALRNGDRKGQEVRPCGR